MIPVGGHGVRGGVLSPLRPRSHQHGQEADERRPHHRGRAAPAQVQDARPHGGHHLRGRGAARPGEDRRHQRILLPQERRALCHLYQGGVFFQFMSSSDLLCLASKTMLRFSGCNM